VTAVDDAATAPLTFLFTDLEGSTRTWERAPEAMSVWLAEHDRLVVAALTANGGHAFKHTGDGVCAVFRSAVDAARAAAAVQRSVGASREVGALRVRIAVHTGEALARGDDYFGPTLNRCARLLGVAHGGQVLLSSATAALVAHGDFGDDMALLDLGQHRLRDLQRPERIWQLVGPGLLRDFPPLRSLDAFLQNLPVQRSSFVGREPEIVAVRERLGAGRLVTITGVGGCGKTRIALEAAARELDRFGDGVIFVDLSTLFEPSLVGATLAAAIQMPATAGSAEDRVIEFLCDRRALIVLDNCEHLLDACADIVDRLLVRCPDVAVLATSREPLALDGEQVWRVPSLRLPSSAAVEEIAQSEAVRLFVDRAVAVRPDFALTAQNAAAVAEICGRLDGIPLALELAAARVAHLAPREIADRLQDRFRLLSAGRRGVQRQQTLQAALDWSYELLSEPERVLLRRLSVFAGGCDLDAVEAVCSGAGLEREAMVGVLGSLAARSLVSLDECGGRTRYRLLETVRLYAQGHLLIAGEADATRSAHAEWCLHQAEATAPTFSFAAGLLDLPPRADLDLDNVRQAAEWFLANNQYDRLGRVAVATTNELLAQARLEEPDLWLAAALAAPDALSADLQTACLASAAYVAEIRGDFPLANERARAAIAIGAAPGAVTAAYGLLVTNLTWMDYAEAERLVDGAVAAAKRAQIPVSALEDDLRAGLALARGDYSEAVARAAALTSKPTELIWGRYTLGVALLLNGDPATAGRVLDAMATPNLLRSWSAYFLTLLRALVVAEQGDKREARRLLLESAAIVRRWKVPLGLADCVLGTAVLAFRRGDYHRASELLAAAHAATGGSFRSPASMCLYRHHARALRHELDRETAARARAAGATVTLDEALARELALELTGAPPYPRGGPPSRLPPCDL
jgi:predicted ATPase/class 3 adenylate cyclase